MLGPEAFARELQEERDDYAVIAGTPDDRPIAVFTFANYGPRASRRVIYSKGSLVLHMLRFVIGDDAFRRSLAAFFQRTRGRAARRGSRPRRGGSDGHTPAAIREIEVDPGKWLIQSNYKNDRFEA